MNSGIYRIVVRRLGRPALLYVGQAQQMERRWRDHLKDLAGHRHFNRRLQALFDKYGRSVFSFEIIVACRADDLTFYEQIILDFYAKLLGKSVLNICRHCCSSPIGTTRTAEVRARLSAAKKGKPGRRWTDEQKAKVSATKRGTTPSHEQIEAHRILMTGRSASAETRAKMSAAQIGRKLSDETKQKMRTSAALRNQSLEYRTKLSASLIGNQNARGRVLSDETRQKLSRAALLREAKRRAACAGPVPVL